MMQFVTFFQVHEFFGELYHTEFGPAQAFLQSKGCLLLELHVGLSSHALTSGFPTP